MSINYQFILSSKIRLTYACHFKKKENINFNLRRIQDVCMKLGTLSALERAK